MGSITHDTVVCTCTWAHVGVCVCVCVILSNSVTVFHLRGLLHTFRRHHYHLELYQISMEAQLNLKINLGTKCLLGVIICIYCV